MEKTIDIPEGVTVEKQGSMLVVKGPKGSLQMELEDPLVSLEISGNSVKFKSKNTRRKVLALTGTFAAHTRNMILGVTRGYEARMKVIYSHFPMKIKVEGSSLVIQNFMGGRSSRSVNIIEGVKIDVKKDDITVSGIDREAVGQTAGRIEQAVKVKGFDRRVFQDGIHLVQKTFPKE